MKIRAALRLLGAPLLLTCTFTACSPSISMQLENEVALAMQETGRCREAILIWEEQVATLKKEHGKNSLLVADTLRSIALCNMELGDLGSAERLLLEEFSIENRALGSAHLSVAGTLMHLGNLNTTRGDFTKAEAFLRETLSIEKNKLGDDHPNVAITLYVFGNLEMRKENFEAAERFWRESLRIQEKMLGREHPHTAQTLAALGLVNLRQRNYTEAERLLRESLRIAREVLHSEDHYVAPLLCGIGQVLMMKGSLKEAEQFLNESLKLKREEMGPDDSLVATILCELADLHYYRGNLKKSEQLFRESLRIKERLLGPEHGDLAYVLYALAILRNLKNDSEGTERLLLRAIHIQRTVELPEFAGEPQAEYADFLLARGQEQEAEHYFKEALDFARRKVGHPYYSLISRLKSLGRFYQESERYPEAGKAFVEAIGLADKKGERASTDLLAWYSEVLIAQGMKSSQQIAETRKWISRALRQDLDELQELLLAVDEKKLDRRLTEQAKRVDFLFALLNKKTVTQEQRQFALAVSLARKALFIAVDATGAQALHAELPESARGDLEQLRSLWQEESKWSMLSQHPRALGDANVQSIYRATVEKRRALQRRLMNMLPAQYRQVDVAFDDSLKRIANQLRPKEVFLDLVLHYPPQFSTRSKDPRPPSSQGRYHAFLLYPDGHVVDRDLGPAKDIDAALKEMSRDLDKRSVSVIQRAAQTAYRLTLAPLAPYLQEAKKIYVAADGEFVRHQLGLLHDSRGYLIDRFIFSPLNSGRDLLPTTAPRSDARGIYALVNPSIRSQSFLASVRSSTRSGCLPDFSKVGDTLPSSVWEGDVIRRMFPDPQVFEQEQASEEQLLRIKQPLALHIGTHGIDCNSTAETRPSVRTARGTTQEAATETPNASALLLSGAERYLKPWIERRIVTDGVVDGIVTFVELAQMDLRGTQLVVLAACLSGMGAVRRGQGLLGLRSALFVAGAETVVTTLGNVDDRVTEQLMTAYYQHLKDGEGRISALRSAALEIKRQNPHPFYWAPFLAVGRDEPLRLNP